MYTAKERLYTTADGGRLVPEGDPEAAILLAPKGGDVPDDHAKRLGLIHGSGESAAEKQAAEFVAMQAHTAEYQRIAAERASEELAQLEDEEARMKFDARLHKDADVAVGRLAANQAKLEDDEHEHEDKDEMKARAVPAETKAYKHADNKGRRG